MRSEILFNDDWLFYPEKVDNGKPDLDFEQVIIPQKPFEYSYSLK